MENSLIEKYSAVIGLEVHAQLLTKSKIFSTDAAAFGDDANTNLSVVTLAYPGTLPKVNKKAIEFAIRMGLACGCEITRYTFFDRKNYFYPDLPKGYQLTQDRAPICKKGEITIKIKEGEKAISLNRIHLEEDAGKSIHHENEPDTLVDLNRAGVPLIEIVTEPVIGSSEEAGALLSEIRKIVRYLNICDGNMEEGSLRCDANVSVMLKGASQLGKKVEIKNMNSIRNVQAAIDSEIERQISLVEKGKEIISETRTFNVQDGKTYSMRTKEELNDYRYFPDPDLSPIVISEEWLQDIQASMPELPSTLVKRLIQQYNLPSYDAEVLTETKELAAYFEEVCRFTPNYKAASNWIMGAVKSYLNEKSIEIEEFELPAQKLAQLINLVDEGKVSYTMAYQKLFSELLQHPAELPLDLATRMNLLQESDVNSLLPIIEEIIKEFPLKVEEYKNGKKGIVSMFMGELMKRSKGKADPKVASDIITKKLNDIK